MSFHPSDPSTLVENTTSDFSSDFSHPPALHNTYTSSPPIFLTPIEQLIGLGRVTCKTNVHGIVNHLPGAIIETPVSGSQTGVAIAHIFPIDPLNFVHPKDNIQYSLGGHNHSGQPSVECLLLRDKDTGGSVKCEKVRYSCKWSTCFYRWTDLLNFLIQAARQKNVRSIWPALGALIPPWPTIHGAKFSWRHSDFTAHCENMDVGFPVFSQSLWTKIGIATLRTMLTD